MNEQKENFIKKQMQRGAVLIALCALTATGTFGASRPAVGSRTNQAQDVTSSPVQVGFKTGPPFLQTGQAVVATKPSAAAAGDFNGDGVDDTALITGPSAVTIHSLNDQGNIVGTTQIDLADLGATGPFAALAAGDVDKNGKADLLIASPTLVFVIYSVGPVLFTVRAFPGDSDPSAIAVGDFNGDGSLDFVEAGRQSNTAVALFNNGIGIFGQGRVFEVVPQPTGLAVGDFDGNGKSDFAVFSNQSNRVAIVPDASNSFQSRILILNSPVIDAVAGDFNSDGKVDLAIARSAPGGNGVVSILFGLGIGGFRREAVGVPVVAPVDLAAADFNNDGRPDLALASAGSVNGVTVFLSGGIGRILPTAQLDLNEPPLFITPLNFNRDGLPDLAVTTQRFPGGAIRLFRNEGLQ